MLIVLKTNYHHREAVWRAWRAGCRRFSLESNFRVTATNSAVTGAYFIENCIEAQGVRRSYWTLVPSSQCLKGPSWLAGSILLTPRRQWSGARRLVWGSWRSLSFWVRLPPSLKSFFTPLGLIHRCLQLLCRYLGLTDTPNPCHYAS